MFSEKNSSTAGALNAVITGSNGRLWATGYVDSGGSGSVDAVVLCSEGSYDGFSQIQDEDYIGDKDYGYALAFDSQNRLYMVGSVTGSGGVGNDLAIWRYEAVGTDSTCPGSLTLDTTFNGSGLLVLSDLNGTGVADVGRSVAIDSDDNVYITGDSGSRMVLIKLKP